MTDKTLADLIVEHGPFTAAPLDVVLATPAQLNTLRDELIELRQRASCRWNACDGEDCDGCKPYAAPEPPPGPRLISFGPNLVECPHCDGAAMSQAALNEHLRVRHGDS
jgi:hypothetical protein